MKRTELAGLLNGLERPIPKDLRTRAARAGLVILCGPWATFYGVIEGEAQLLDENGTSTSGPVYFDAEGVLPQYDEVDTTDEHEARAFFDRKRLAVKVDVEVVHEGHDRRLWRFVAPFPHSTFTILDDGEPYSKGIVFSLEDAGLHVHSNE